MKQRSYTIKGVSPIVMHNAQLSDPLNFWAKELRKISKKKTKTEEDLMEMSRVEWMGGLYYTPELGVHVPENCIERMLRDAATKSKRGKDVLAGLVVIDPAKLIYSGAKDPEDMWKQGKFLLRGSVAVKKQRVIRSRPIFREWGLSFTVNYDENVLDAEEIDGFVELAGRLVGLGDWRPKHGRFVMEAAR